jgi:hypothetical protein
MDISAKAAFLQKDFLEKLSRLDPEAQGQWGKMKGQHMVEHFTDSVKLAFGHFKLPLMNEGEALESAYRFMMSDTPFRENIRNPATPEVPGAFKKAGMQDALDSLSNAIARFFAHFQANPDDRITNPFFGHLNYEEQVHLLYKHAQHHLRQFGLL